MLDFGNMWSFFDANLGISCPFHWATHGNWFSKQRWGSLEQWGWSSGPKNKTRPLWAGNGGTVECADLMAMAGATIFSPLLQRKILMKSQCFQWENHGNKWDIFHCWVAVARCSHWQQTFSHSSVSRNVRHEISDPYTLLIRKNHWSCQNKHGIQNQKPSNSSSQVLTHSTGKWKHKLGNTSSTTECSATDGPDGICLFSAVSGSNGVFKTHPEFENSDVQDVAPPQSSFIMRVHAHPPLNLIYPPWPHL